MKMAIVEDEIRIREGIAGLLNKYYPQAAEIREAACGEDGLHLIRELKPDVVITDIRMEPMDGLEMLEILLNQDKMNFKTVILSSYSEFEYAKKAISLGVREYLVKPVDVEEFRLIMKRLEAELANDEKKRLGNVELFNSMESILSGIITGQMEADQKLKHFIEKTYSIKPDAEMALLCIYLGKFYDENYMPVSRTLRSLLEKERMPNDTLLFVPKDRLLLQLFPGGHDFTRMEQFCRDVIVKNIMRQHPVPLVTIFSRCRKIETLSACFEQIKRHLDWSISLGIEQLIVMEVIKNLKPTVPSYPIQTERQSIVLLCGGKGKELEKQVKLFLEYFTGHNFLPEVIKKCVVRYFLALFQIIKETRFSAYEKINEKETLERINSAQTGIELEEALLCVFTTANSEVKPERVSILVQKVLRLIDEYYRDGITLKEVANELEVSPDYISTKLTEELGVNFSTYIKDYRLKKAKELLAGTDLKIFEVAEQTGYKDAKYFGKVFKEAEDIHPLEYRKKFR
jgi:two-component system response regulator YesN